MTQTAVEIVHAYYDALEHGDMTTLLAIASEQILVEGATSLPYAGKCQGRIAWVQFAEKFQQVWDNPVFAIENIHETGDCVVGLARLKATSKKTKKMIDMPMAEFFWIEDGKISRLLPFYWDTAAVIQAIN